MTKTIESAKALKKTYRSLFSYLHGCWKDTILTWIAVLGESICEVLVAFFMQFLIDAVKGKNNSGPIINDIYLYSGLIAGIAIIAAVLGILAGFWAASASSGFGRNLRKAMYDHIQGLFLQKHR
jgi:ATP-binding cassette subfamily B protein